MAPVLCCSVPVTRVPFPAVLLLVLLQQARSLPSAVAARTNLTAGATMAPPDYITSPSGGFAFGFRAFTSDPTKFLLATWFRFGGDDSSQPQPDPESVVWFAKQSPSGATPYATAQSVLSITADGQLTLTDGSNQVLWTPSLERGSVLALRDSGNLQFLSDSGSQVLWESFWYPTDTLLPGQSLVYDPARSEGKVFAKRADAEFTTGRFSMGIQSDGNVVLYVDLLKGNDPHNAYWQAYTNSPDGNTTVTFDDRGRLNYTLHNGTVSSLIKPAASFAAGEYFQFARMDPDGIVRTYIRPKDGGTGGNTSWTVSGAFPDYGCIKWTSGLQGMCGPGSYCLSAPTPSSRDRLNCVCPSGYNYTDEQHRDSGCTPAFEPQSCDGENSSDEFTLVELLNTTWEASIYYKRFSSVTEEQCREYCLRDCFCAAALMIGGSDCAEVAVLTNGWRANGVTTKALIKVRTRNSQVIVSSASSRTRNAFAYMLIAISLAFVLIIAIGGLVAQHCVTRNRERQRLLNPSVRPFSWKELHEATDGFEKLLGKGSFGEVYKGTIRSPQPHLIAVKKLISSNEYSEQEFTNEVQSIGQIHHRNLVRMIGYCKQGNHRMLVFEFMSGGSLRSFLFNPETRPPWHWRAEAALSIARGLEYLHDGCVAPIIRCDIKPDNILLDGHGTPKITDFGISKLLGSQQVHTTVTHVRGTRGYIAPEWLHSSSRVDTKADVHSFGVVLLEMISCRKCHEPVAPDPPQRGEEEDETVTLFGWAAQLVSARRAELMLHGDADVDTVEDRERVERFARVALWCIDPNPLLRPTMHQVVQVLETSRTRVEALPDPADCYMESSPLIPQLKIE
ncbi:G-type lectin S-receptor-like serine/threonine-protein kinase RLK1 [Panicum miliaceum]|uniref:Receptor-like serine/threonine-protein kinase n=1 Tax=Panicum miliaceum TaxID=4540 RepID=A0A3L6T4N7_PANMI|nr:G-type lectin S-receptor-like serine/threonine-protein kinase RLK1 [Panicum miliaceum]